jgi:hypothetical protein
MMHGIRKLTNLNQWQLKDLDGDLQRKLREKSLDFSYRPLPLGTLLILVSQQIVYVSLAIFSKSHIAFTALSVLNLYTLYHVVAYPRWMSVDWRFSKFSRQGNVDFRWNATSFIGTKGKEGVRAQLESFLRAIEAFEIINSVKADPVYAEKDLLQELQEGGQVVERELSVSLDGKKLKLIPLDYSSGKEISVFVEGFNHTTQTLHGKLQDGTIVHFPNIHPEKAQRLEQAEVGAQIISKFTRDNNLYLVCSLQGRLKEGKGLMARSMEHGGVSVKIEGDVFIGEVDSEEGFKGFRLVNQVRRVPLTVRGKEVGARYEVYAEKDSRPFCDQLLVWVKDDQWGWCLAEVSWIDYEVSGDLEVKIERVDEIAKVVYGSCPDGTIIRFTRAFLELAKTLKGRTIEAQIISKHVENGFLHLECSSDALLPNPKRIIFERVVELSSLPWRIQMKYHATFKPTLSEEECPICFESSEVLYSICKATHLFCEPCLTTVFNEKMAALKLVNLQTHFLNLLIHRTSLLTIKPVLIKRYCLTVQFVVGQHQLKTSFLLR